VTAATISPALIGALDAAWARIRELHPDVPEVVITFASGSIAHGSRSGELLGHFAPGRWQRGAELLHEFFVSGEHFRAGPHGVLETLLHEATHGLAAVRDIADTSDRGRHHNRRYADLAREIGLDVAYSGSRRGWNDTALPDATAAQYTAVLRRLGRALTAWRHPEPARHPDRARSDNGVAAVCGCPRRIRVAASVLAAGPITCGVCGDDFTEDG
jgi:hypothetical protein